MLKWCVFVVLLSLFSSAFAGERCQFQSRSGGTIQCLYSVVKPKDKLLEWAQSFCQDRGKNLSYKEREFINCSSDGGQCMIFRGRCQ